MPRSMSNSASMCLTASSAIGEIVAAFFPRHLFCLLFVNRIAIAIEEHDGDRFDAARFQFSGRLTHSILIQGQYDLAVRSYPLLHHFT